MATAKYNPELLDIDLQQTLIITRDDVRRANPDPDLFIAETSLLNTNIETAVTVDDSTWDLLTAILECPLYEAKS